MTGADDSIVFLRLSAQELSRAMHEDRVAGAVVIPADFDRAIASLLPGAPGMVARPVVSIAVNAGDGGLGNGLVIGSITPLLRGVAQNLGDRLALASGDAGLPAANATLVAEPFDVVTAPYSPLPDNSGLGTSAFYYSLTLIPLVLHRRFPRRAHGRLLARGDSEQAGTAGRSSALHSAVEAQHLPRKGIDPRGRCAFRSARRCNSLQHGSVSVRPMPSGSGSTRRPPSWPPGSARSQCSRPWAREQGRS